MSSPLRDFQEQYDLSRSTVRQALATLEREGLIVRERGRGTRVASAPYIENLPGLRSFSEEMRHIGRVPDARVLEISQGPPPPEVLAALGMDDGDEAICLHRLMCIDGKPVVTFRSYLPKRLGVTLDPSFNGSLYALLEDSYRLPLREAWETIEAAGCPADTAELLGLEAGDPVLVRRRLTCTTNQMAVEYVEGIYHGQRYKYSLHLHRQKPGTHHAPSPLGLDSKAE
jgi:GntR family transcriptional regulator